MYSIHRYPTHLIQSLVLANGRRVTLRPVLPQDDALECAFVAALSSQSRRNRFHGAVNGLAAAQAARMTCVDYHEHMAFVATVVEGEGADEHEVLVADARYAITADRETAEFAVVVADAWAGLGLARRLLALLGQCARRAGLRWLRGEVLAANHAMLALMRRCGFCAVAHPEDDGLVLVENSVEAMQVQPRPGRMATWLATLATWMNRPVLAVAAGV